MTEPIDGPLTSRSVRAFMNRIDNPTTLRTIRTRARLGGWVGSREAGCRDTKQADAIADAAFDAVLRLLRDWAAETGWPVPPAADQETREEISRVILSERKACPDHPDGLAITSCPRCGHNFGLSHAASLALGDMWRL
jgi:hypothetical protein